jgi:hypothetical protein
MKKIFTLLSIIGFGLITHAQEATKSVPEIPESIQTTRDTSEVHMNGKKIIIISDETNRDSKSQGSTKTVAVFSQRRNRVWQGFEIGFTGVSYTPEFNTEIPDGLQYFEPIVSNSINWAINPFEMDVRIVGEYVKFSTGLGYTARNFTLANNYLLYKDQWGVTTGAQDGTRKLARNRFRTGYITIPAMIYFNSSDAPQRAWRVGAGVVFGTRIFEAYRLKYDQDGHNSREKYNGGYNANPMMLDMRAILGYGGINFYATYSTMGLFNPGFGPEVYPFTVGISFVNSY